MTEPRTARLQLVEEPVTLVDSCVLLDLTTEDPDWLDWSSNALADAANAGPIIINPIIYAEVSVDFARVEDLDEALPRDEYRREKLPFETGFLAGKAFVRYRRAGGAKRSPMPHFYIGAHAAVRNYQLLTRDTSRYETYFPRVQLITPATEERADGRRTKAGTSGRE